MKKNQKKGHFIISLDFEKLWGVRDKRTINDYGNDIKNVSIVIERTLELFEKFHVKATFSTVGLLFAESKDEILEHCPALKPSYDDMNLSPYNGHFELVKPKSSIDPYHYAPDSILLIKSYNQDIGTHTFSHYYCMEKGQTKQQFRADIISALNIAKKYNIEQSSIVFPRNNVNIEYLNVLNELGIKSYRGNLDHWAYEILKQHNHKIKAQRLYRLLDSYINLSGYNTHDLNQSIPFIPVNIPASRFLRPYSNKLRFLEPLKQKRIKSSMTHAAKYGEMYHLWWHPHNFGSNMEQNFQGLEDILKHFKFLSETYDYKSASMESLTDELNK